MLFDVVDKNGEPCFLFDIVYDEISEREYVIFKDLKQKIILIDRITKRPAIINYLTIINTGKKVEPFDYDLTSLFNKDVFGIDYNNGELIIRHKDRDIAQYDTFNASLLSLEKHDPVFKNKKVRFYTLDNKLIFLSGVILLAIEV